jgi:hypothetical protein
MNDRRYRIEYGPTALNDLDSLAERIRKQVLRKIERLKSGLHGDINCTFAEPMWPIDCGPAIIASCLMWKVTLLLSAESDIAKTCMTKTLEREIGRTVRQKRQQLSVIREEVENLLDYLDVLEARAKDAGKPRLNHDEVKKRYG